MTTVAVKTTSLIGDTRIEYAVRTISTELSGNYRLGAVILAAVWLDHCNTQDKAESAVLSQLYSDAVVLLALLCGGR